MKERMARGLFYLSAGDIESFRGRLESAHAIGKRKGVATSLVTYHLRKLNDQEINDLLTDNANNASADFKANRLEKVQSMILDGRPSTEIIDTCHVSTNTLTKVRKQMGLSSNRKRAKKKKEVAIQPKPLPSIKQLISDVMDTKPFIALTKRWPINLEQTTMASAG